MEHLKQECKLCDNIISDINFKVIDDDAKEILDILLLKKLNETKNAMCTTCSSALIAAYNFKTKCLYTNNSIRPYIDFKNPKPVDLKQIYAKEKGNKQGGRSLDDWDICRLCLEPVGSDQKSIQEVPVGSIQIYIPEINFEATTNPVICIKCHDVLHVHSTFMKTCMDINKKRNGDENNCEEILLNGSSIKTEEIEIKSEETDAEVLFETICDIKEEEHEEGDTLLQSQIDSMYTEESKSLYDLDEREKTTVANYQSEECSFKSTSESLSAGDKRRCKRVSEAQVIKSDRSSRNLKRRCLTRSLNVQQYKCDKCTYNTKYKSNLMQHQLIHKDPSEVRRFKCDQCDYKSTRKDRLKQHQMIHKDPAAVKVFKCGKCTFQTKHERNLVAHCRIHKDPSEVKMYKCEKCKFVTKHKGSIRIHCLSHKDPSEVEMFKCDKCAYETIQKSNLIKHCSTHKDPSELKMFRCDKCTFETKYKKSLIAHCWTHKDPSEVQMLECGDCDYRTINRSCLKRHELIHKHPSEVQRFKCDICKFTTKHKMSLIRHCLRHKDLSEVQMFECGDCDYKTINRSCLKRHELIHGDPSEVQRFKCDKCKFTTKRKMSLIQHCSRHKHPSVP